LSTPQAATPAPEKPGNTAKSPGSSTRSLSCSSSLPSGRVRSSTTRPTCSSSSTSTSILGGEGAIWRTVVGVLFIAIIGNGFTLLAWNPLYEQITLGVILLLAVGGDAWSRLRTD
jgi:hypothetical protein